MCPHTMLVSYLYLQNWQAGKRMLHSPFCSADAMKPYLYLQHSPAASARQSMYMSSGLGTLSPRG